MSSFNRLRAGTAIGGAARIPPWARQAVPHLDPGVDSELRTPDQDDPSQPRCRNQPGAALDLDVNRFGIDLYHRLETPRGNLVVSPLS